MEDKILEYFKRLDFEVSFELLDYTTGSQGYAAMVKGERVNVDLRSEVRPSHVTISYKKPTTAQLIYDQYLRDEF